MSWAWRRNAFAKIGLLEGVVVLLSTMADNGRGWLLESDDGDAREVECEVVGCIWDRLKSCCHVLSCTYRSLILHSSDVIHPISLSFILQCHYHPKIQSDLLHVRRLVPLTMDLGSVFALCIATFIICLVQLLVIAGLAGHALNQPRQRRQDLEARDTIVGTGTYRHSMPEAGILGDQEFDMSSERIPSPLPPPLPPPLPLRPKGAHPAQSHPNAPRSEDMQQVRSHRDVSPLSSPRPISGASSDSLYSDPTPSPTPRSRSSNPQPGARPRESLRDVYNLDTYLDRRMTSDWEAYEREVKNVPNGY